MSPLDAPLNAPVRTTLALKEWGAVVHALLQGSQTVLLRKGGIHEKAFGVEGAGQGVVVLPTVAHSHAERVRPEHVDLLPLGEADVAEDRFTVRCGLVVVDTIAVTRPEHLHGIADLHIWTDASVQADRVDFRPRHDLTAMVVRAVELREAVTLPRVEEYAGCRSWVDLPIAWDGISGRAATDEERLFADAARIRSVVG